MARPLKDRRLADVQIIAALKGVIRVENDRIAKTRASKEKQGMELHRDHLISLVNRLEKQDENATVQVRQKGSRLLPYECSEPLGGCGYKIRVTGIWVSIAAPICPNPHCALFQKSMEFAGAFFRAQVADADAVENAQKDDVDRAAAIKELEDFFGPEAGDITILDRAIAEGKSQK